MCDPERGSMVAAQAANGKCGWGADDLHTNMLGSRRFHSSGVVLMCNPYTICKTVFDSTVSSPSSRLGREADGRAPSAVEQATQHRLKASELLGFRVRMVESEPLTCEGRTCSRARGSER